MKTPTDHLHDRGTERLLADLANTPLPECTACGAPLTDPGPSSVCERCEHEARRAKDRARPRLIRHLGDGLAAAAVAGAGFVAAFHQAEPAPALPTANELSPAGPHDAPRGSPAPRQDDPWRGFLWTA